MTDSAKSGREPNWGLGAALGIGIGVALSVALDNWAFIGIGVAFMAAFAYVFGTQRPADEDPAGDGDERPDA